MSDVLTTIMDHTVIVPMMPAPPPNCTPEERSAILPGNIGTHLEMQMNAMEAEICHRIHQALTLRQAVVGDGRRLVKNRADLVRWWFERLAESVGYGQETESAAEGPTAARVAPGRASIKKSPADRGPGTARGSGVRAP